MATSRIYRVLPERVREWNLTTCASEIRNRKALDEVRDKQVSYLKLGSHKSSLY